MNINQLLCLIRSGEGERLEFKQDISDIGRVVSAFANTEGGTVLIGVADNGDIVGIKDGSIYSKISDHLAAVTPHPKTKISKMEFSGKRLIIIDILKGPHLYAHRNIAYIRLGRNCQPLSIQEVVEKAGESLRLFFDELIADHKVDLLSKKLVKRYVKEREKVRGVIIKSIDYPKMLIQLRAAKRKGRELLTTNGGLLFFSSTSQKVIPYARIHLIHFSDEEMKHYADQRMFEGSLWKVIEQVGEYFQNNMARLGGGLKGFRRMEYYEYPMEAIREAVCNALIHRNYFDASEIKIFWMPDRLVIRNPGAFPPGVTPEHPEHKPRNPLLAQYFYDIGYIEKYGGGIDKMRRACQNHPGVALEFDLKPTSTTVIFRKTVAELRLDKTDEAMLREIQLKPTNAKRLAQIAGMSRQAAVKRLNRLLQMHLIKRQGKGAGVKYLPA